MIKSLSDAYSAMSARHLNTRERPALPVPQLPSHPTLPPTPGYAMHFSTRKKALYGAGPGQCIIKYIELAPCRHPPHDRG